MVMKKTFLLLRTSLLLIGLVGILWLCKDMLYDQLRNNYTGSILNNRTISTLRGQHASPPSNNGQCSNSGRLKYLKQMCKLRSSSIEYSETRLVEDKKHKLLYCEVSKAGCTTVKAIWIEANKRPPGSKNMSASELRVKEQTVHELHVMKRAGLYLHFLKNWTSQFQTYIKFITARHPYDRLVSAYYNLIYWKRGQGDGQPYVQDVFKQRFKHSIHGDLKLLAFEQFLTVVTDPTVTIYNDRHWIPFAESCFVCHQEYDYILKTETLYRDLEGIMKHLGHPDMKLLKVKMNAVNRVADHVNITSAMEQSRHGWNKHLPEFETLSPKTKEAVAERYKNDMDMFGYNFDEKTNVASCSSGENPDATYQCC